jgi:hypothetical protein
VALLPPGARQEPTVGARLWLNDLKASSYYQKHVIGSNSDGRYHLAHGGGRSDEGQPVCVVNLTVGSFLNIPLFQKVAA